MVVQALCIWPLIFPQQQRQASYEDIKSNCNLIGTFLQVSAERCACADGRQLFLATPHLQLLYKLTGYTPLCILTLNLDSVAAAFSKIPVLPCRLANSSETMLTDVRESSFHGPQQSAHM